MPPYGYAYRSRTLLSPPQPAAGAGFTVPVPGSEFQRLIAVTFRIVTSAVVATRTPCVIVQDGTGANAAIAVGGLGVTASTTADYSFCYGLSEWDAAGGALASGPGPRVPLEFGDSIVLSINSVDAGDQISRIRIVLEQIPIRDDYDG